MRSGAICAVLAVATTALASTGWGVASAAAAKGPNTFEGTCQLSGEMVFDQPLGNELRTTTFTGTTYGTCDGTLNGVPGTDIPVINSVSGSGTLSCLAGETSTDDTLTFARRYPIRIFTDAVGGLTQFTAYTRGAVSGESVEEVDFLPYFDEADQAACQAGTLSSARYDLIARTITPLVG
jgi:hypothetical protein